VRLTATLASTPTPASKSSNCYFSAHIFNESSIFRFDPGRYAAGQDKSQAHAYLGWGKQTLAFILRDTSNQRFPGVGRHPCAGKRFAQFEIKIMCAMFLASVSTSKYRTIETNTDTPALQYTYDVVDSTGKKPDPSATVPDKNNIYQVRR
jgi:hypothetical protein